MTVLSDAVEALLAASPSNAEPVVPIITSMVKSYTRGRGFDEDGNPNDELAAVIVAASARMAANVRQVAQSSGMDGLTADTRTFFQGWNLAEQFVLNRYRKRAM